jgi:hypothetical protein
MPWLAFVIGAVHQEPSASKLMTSPLLPGVRHGDFTERHCAAPTSTDSRQRRFSTQFSAQKRGAAELRSRISWSQRPTGTATGVCQQPSKLVMRVRLLSLAPM